MILPLLLLEVITYKQILIWYRVRQQIYEELKVIWKK